MIYFIAGRKDNASRAAQELRIHATGWKYLCREEDVHGINAAVIIVLDDTLFNPSMSRTEHENQHHLLDVADFRHTKNPLIQIVHLSLDHLVGVLRMSDDKDRKTTVIDDEGHFRKRESGEDTERVNAVERHQWHPRCVEFHQWELDDYYMRDEEMGKGVPHTVKGRSWREVVDGARSGPYGA